MKCADCVDGHTEFGFKDCASCGGTGKRNPTPEEWKAGEHPDILEWERQRYELLATHYPKCKEALCPMCAEFIRQWRNGKAR